MSPTSLDSTQLLWLQNWTEFKPKIVSRKTSYKKLRELQVEVRNNYKSIMHSSSNSAATTKHKIKPYEVKCITSSYMFRLEKLLSSLLSVEKNK